MTIDRTTIIQGPAVVTYGGASFFSKGDVTVKPMVKRFALSAAHTGKIEERNTDIRVEVTFEPAGQLSVALAAVLWPYASTLPGTSIYGATDSALVVHGRDGVSLTLPNAALTQMPALRIATGQTPLGPLKFTGLLANSSDPDTEASYLTWATAPYPGDTGFDPAEIITLAAVGVWDYDVAFASILAEGGWEFNFGLTLTDVAVDGLGTVDMKVADVTATASCVPVGIAAAAFVSALHGAVAIGARPDEGGLTVTGGTVVGTLGSCALTDVEMIYGAARKRVGRCTWTAIRSFTESVPDALFSATGGEGEPET